MSFPRFYFSYSLWKHIFQTFQELSLTRTYLMRRMEPFFPLHDVWYRPILFLCPRQLNTSTTEQQQPSSSVIQMATATSSVWVATCHPGPRSPQGSSPAALWPVSLAAVWFLPRLHLVSLGFSMLASPSADISELVVSWLVDVGACEDIADLTVEKAVECLWGGVELDRKVDDSCPSVVVRDVGAEVKPVVVIVDTVTGWPGVLSSAGAVVACALVAVVRGFVVGTLERGWGAGAGGWMNWRLSGGRGSEAFSRL